VWSAGCSFGEETYSLAILLKEMDLLCKSRLYATDISTKALDKSKKNLLLMTLKNIPLILFMWKESLNQYFVSDGQKSIISSDFKKKIFYFLDII
jgi:chemotaxis protein methyltransferase CheR